MDYKIKLENATKYYTIKTKKNIKDILLHPFHKKEQKKILALNKINLIIKKGESLGIIGRNGAGKTTMLKILSNIIPISSGNIYINGKITSLIELGIGFNPELTGIENIYLTTSFYGLSRKETSKILNNIVTFSELKNFITIPIKYYSTGMTLRLGFSIASHLNPDILIIDEILSVGDEYFQNKCINKILDLKSIGTTLIMVSHNMNLLYSLSDRILWLDTGKIKYLGDKKIAIKKYINFIEQKELIDATTKYIFNKDSQIKGMHIKGPITHIIINFPNTLYSNSDVSINFAITTTKIVRNVIIGFAIHTIDGALIFGTNTKLHKKKIDLKTGKNKLNFKIKKFLLNQGLYTLSVDVHTNNLKKNIASIFKQIKFKVINEHHLNDGPVIINGKWS